MGFPKDFAQFWADYAEWQELVNEAFEKASEDKKLAKNQIRASLGNADLLDALDYDQRARLIKHFNKKVLKVDDIFTGNIDSVFAGLGPETRPGVQYGKAIPQPGDVGGDSAFVLNQLGITRDASKVLKGEEFSTSRNIPKMEFIKQQMEHQRAGYKMKAGAKVFVFDTETLGLGAELSSVREVASLNMTMAGGDLVSESPGQIKTKSFNVARGGYGSIWDERSGKYVQLGEHLKTLAGNSLVSGVPADGNTFIRSLMPQLKEMAAADYIVGQNVNFDVRQLLVNAMKTGAYAGGEDVVDDVGRVIFSGKEVQQVIDSIAGKIDSTALDTLIMARNYLPNLDLAPELAALGEKSPHGLENIMLQTNLSDLIKKENKDFFADAAQHTAGYDTYITGQFFRFMKSGQLAAQPLSDKALRLSTLRSYAPTPISHLDDARDISRDMFRAVYDTSPTKIRAVKIGEDTLEALLPGDADLWYDRLAAQDSDYAVRVGASMIEQEVFSTRKIIAPSATAGDITENLGQWRKFSGYDETGKGFLNRLHTLFKGADTPSASAFRGLQQGLADAGMPFAGISMPERIVTASASFAGTLRGADLPSLSSELQDVAKYGDDIGMSFWTLRKEASTLGDNVTLPLALLQEGGFIDDDLQMLSMSTIEKSKDVNLMFKLKDQAEAERLASHIEGIGSSIDDIERYGISDNNYADIAERIRTRGTQYGVNVAHMGGQGGRQLWHTLKDMFQGITFDDSMASVRTGFSKEGIRDGYIVAGATTFDEYADDAQRAAYKTDYDLGLKKTEELGSALRNKGTKLGVGIDWVIGGRYPGVGKTVETIYNTAKKRLPVVGAVGVGALGAYYMYNKHKEQEVYDDSMQQMRLETSEDYSQYREDFGLYPAPAVRRPDPLLTAGIVGNLDRNAVGHTRMGARKDAGLFAGVI